MRETIYLINQTGNHGARANKDTKKWTRRVDVANLTMLGASQLTRKRQLSVLGYCTNIL